MTETKRDQAAALLLHYICMATEHGPAYVKLSWDVHEEIKSIVDLIIDAAMDRVEKTGLAKENALQDAISELECAIGQSLPSDDQIIIGHMQRTVGILRTLRRMA